jgi:hypothetical protein
MKATLHKTEQGWIARWSDFQSFLHGVEWNDTLLHPDDQLSDELEEGKKVEIEFEEFEPGKAYFYALLKKPKILTEDEKKIEVGNQLIAEFMGVKKESTFAGERYIYEIFNNKYSTELYFHKSWDWLMPVLIKIENELDVVTSIQINRYKNVGLKEIFGETDVCLFEGQHDTIIKDSSLKIEALWKAIVEFLIWYNSNKKK